MKVMMEYWGDNGYSWSYLKIIAHVRRMFISINLRSVVEAHIEMSDDEKLDSSYWHLKETRIDIGVLQAKTIF